ncbi:MAG: TonB-dependent receptor [Myxococcales bacterium]|nr:TonB-dependent receptor [Myxococcales bacterium]
MRTRRLFAQRLLVLTTLLAVPTVMEEPAQAVGEQNARLQGTILEAGTGVPMPGAKVTVRSDALIGGSKSILTDDEGRFDFLSLPHGTYVVTVEYEGLQPMKRRLKLSLGETRTLKLDFAAELTQGEVTKIFEERARIDSEKVSTGRVLTAEQQAKIATGRSYQNIVQQLPGVVGGANPVMAGGSLRHNRYLVDGLDITDPVSNTFSSNFNFDSIGQVDTSLLAIDAQYNSLGGVINLVTKRGSDKFAVDTSFYLNHQSLSSGARAGTQLYEGRLIDQSEPRAPNAGYQYNLNLSGPLVKQKLWFYLSAELRYTAAAVVPGAPLNTQHATREFYGAYPRLKLTWAPATRHRLELSFNADPAWIYNTVQSNATSNEAETIQKQGGAFTSLNYDWFASDNVIFNLQTGVIYSNISVDPINGDRVSPRHTDAANGIVWNNAGEARFVDDKRIRVQFDPNVTWVKKGWLGQHTFKAGLQGQFIRHYLYTATPGNSTYLDDTAADGAVLARDPTSTERPYGCVQGQPNPKTGSTATPCYQLNTFDPALAQVRYGLGVGAFVQDTWKPTSWLTVVPGLRVDYGRAQNSQGETVQNLLGFGPRLGVNVDLTRDGKTLLKMAYGRANEVTSLLPAFSADATYQTRTWNYTRSTGRFDRFVTSSGGSGGYDLRGRCGDGSLSIECGNGKLSLTPPHSDSVTVSIERELFANVIGGVTYSYRKVSYMWENVELNALSSLDGSRFVQFGDTRYGNVFAYRPTAESFRRYNGIDFVVSGNPNPNWSVFVAYTLSFLDGTADDQIIQLRNDIPRDLRFYGYLADDHRHQVKIQSSYTFHGLVGGINMTYLSGAPATRIYRQAKPDSSGYLGRYSWRGLDPAADPNDLRKWTELRNPDLVEINVRLQYDLHELIRQHLSVIVDLFNILDLSTPIGGSNQAGFESRDIATTFGTVLGRQTPFRAQFGVRYQY